MLRYYQVVVVACLLLVGWLDAVGQLAFGLDGSPPAQSTRWRLLISYMLESVLLEIDLHVDGSVRTPTVLPMAWPSRTPLFAIRMAVL